MEVENYKEKWSGLYKKEKAHLSHIFKDILVDIYHIGSTALPDIKAKPVIDIMVVVQDIKEVDKHNQKMSDLGYEPKGEFGIKDRRFFQKGGNNRTHHVHVFQKGDKEVKRHLNFRDYMCTHPSQARQYSCLKEALAARYPNDIDKYIEGKNDFIKEIDRKAAIWAAER